MAQVWCVAWAGVVRGLGVVRGPGVVRGLGVGAACVLCSRSLLLRCTLFFWRSWFHEALSASHTLTDMFMHTDKRVFLNKLSSVSILLSALLRSA